MEPQARQSFLPVCGGVLRNCSNLLYPLLLDLEEQPHTSLGTKHLILQLKHPSHTTCASNGVLCSSALDYRNYCKACRLMIFSLSKLCNQLSYCSNNSSGWAMPWLLEPPGQCHSGRKLHLSLHPPLRAKLKGQCKVHLQHWLYQTPFLCRGKHASVGNPFTLTLLAVCWCESLCSQHS